MENIIAIFVAIVLFIVFVKLAFFRGLVISIKRWAGYKLKFSTVCSILLIFFVVIAFAMGAKIHFFFPQVSVTSGEELLLALKSTLEAFADAVLYGIQTVLRILEGDTDAFVNAYPNRRCITWALCSGIPVLTVSTVLSVLVNFIPWPLPCKKEYLIFTQVEENSILLAESMMYSENKKTIRKDRLAIFLRMEKNALSPEYELRLKRINAKVFPYTEADLLRIHGKLRRKSIRFFFLSSNTELNFSRMQTLLEEVRNDSLFKESRFVNNEKVRADEQKGIYRQELYLLSETASAPMIIDHLRKDMCHERKNEQETYRRIPVFAHTDLRLLDRYRTVMYELLQEKPLYETADNKKIRVLILGFGRVGKAFFRSAASMCSMAGYETMFYIRDQDMDRQWDNLLLEYPDCNKGPTTYRKAVNVLSSYELEWIFKKAVGSEPFTYIMLSLGDDERNIRLASRLARQYRKEKWKNDKVHLPTICVNLENEIKSDYVSELFKHDEPAVPLHVFGTDNRTFSENMLINRNLWNAARMLHKGLREETDFEFTYWSEYERRSSVASAAHASYHIKSMEAYSSDKNYDISYVRLIHTQKHSMIDAEHRRWMNYSRCEGMQGIDEDTALKIKRMKKHHVDTVAQLTPCMVETEYLDELYYALYPEAAEGEQQVTATGKPSRTFYERDRFVVSNARRLYQIISGEESETLLKKFE